MINITSNTLECRFYGSTSGQGTPDGQDRKRVSLSSPRKRDIFGFHPATSCSSSATMSAASPSCPRPCSGNICCASFPEMDNGATANEQDRLFLHPGLRPHQPRRSASCASFTARGHEVQATTPTNPCASLIEAAGAQFVACDPYDCEQHLTPADGARVGKDIAFFDAHSGRDHPRPRRNGLRRHAALTRPTVSSPT